MTNKLTLLFLTVGLTISCGQKKENFQTTEQELKDLKRKIEGIQLPIELANMKSSDSSKIEHYKIKLNKVRDLVTSDWKEDASKMIINSYIKKSDLSDDYLAYSYQLGQIKTSNEVPRHINDSFDKNFTCYSAEYWKQLNIKQSVQFMWDTLDTRMMVQIISTQ